MTNQKKRQLPDDAERLFKKMVLLPEGSHDLDTKFLDRLGFPTTEDVRKALDQILLYAHQDGWCPPATYIEGNALFCGPGMCESWNSYRS